MHELGREMTEQRGGVLGRAGGRPLPNAIVTTCGNDDCDLLPPRLGDDRRVSDQLQVEGGGLTPCKQTNHEVESDAPSRRGVAREMTRTHLVAKEEQLTPELGSRRPNVDGHTLSTP